MLCCVVTAAVVVASENNSALHNNAPRRAQGPVQKTSCRPAPKKENFQTLDGKKSCCRVIICAYVKRCGYEESIETNPQWFVTLIFSYIRASADCGKSYFFFIYYIFAMTKPWTIGPPLACNLRVLAECRVVGRCASFK